MKPTQTVNTDSGDTLSVWMTTAHIQPHARLNQDLKAEVCIVGAGIAGLSTAYMLASEGIRVVVLDDGPCAGGETGRTTAHLANAIDDRFYELERLHGQEGSRLAAESHGAAIGCIEEIAGRERIDCEFSRLDGFLFAAPPPEGDPRELDRELDAARRAGLTEVEKVHRAPLADFDTGAALRFPRQGQFHPMRYLAGLTEAIQRLGGRIFNYTHVTRFEGGKDAHVGTREGPVVRAEHIVVATNTPVNDRFAIHTKQAPYRTFVVGLRIPRGSVEKALYWDTLDPYHYVRIQHMGDHDLLIVGGEDHKTGHHDDAEQRFARIEQCARQRVPQCQGVEFRWSGQVMEPVDALAYIGRNPMDAGNVYIATGDSGQGMTHGTIAGILLTDLIRGRDNPWAKLYDPSRRSLRATGEFLKENLDVAVQYKDLVTPGEVRSIAEIAPGTGAIVRDGLKKLAIYKDPGGTIHKRSALCPHLGCVVEWNHTEKTWDCPCHGSRFKGSGQVVNGPSLGNMKPE
jgi:glycine/D-amino acid oxidase-like deaminating enzyme/nitrite reductase/ring-hydroxylating ferredoxin subunit